MSGPGVGEVNQHVFRKLLRDQRVTIKGPLSRAASATGKVRGQKGKLDRIRVGPFGHYDLGIREGSVNAIGLGYLSRFKVTLDLANDLLTLKKGNRDSNATSFDMSGLILTRLKIWTTVSHVHPHGLAGKLGICPGDVVLRINDHPVESLSLLEIRRMLARKDEHVRLLFQRRAMPQELKLHLQDLQPEVPGGIVQLPQNGS